jgi:drug/metabolite transporter (DMT)-like permease
MKSLSWRFCFIGGIFAHVFSVAGFSFVGNRVHRCGILQRQTLLTSHSSTRPSSYLFSFQQDDLETNVGLLEGKESSSSPLDQPEMYSRDSKPEPDAHQNGLLQGDTHNGPKHPEGNKNMARLLLIGAAALYGTNFSFVKMLGQTDMSIALSASLRFGLAALVTSPWLFEKTEPPSTNESERNRTMNHKAEITLRGMEVGFWNSAGYIAQAVGLGTTLASKSAFLCSLAVVTVPLLDVATGKRLETRQITGIILALLGVAVLELGGLSASDLALTSGDLASMVQPLAFGIAFWRMEKAMQKYPEEAKRATAAQLLAVFLGSAAYGVVSNPGFFDTTKIVPFLSQPTVLFSLFWTGCVTTALTIYMESTALKSLSAAETTLILSTEPLWGTAFAAATLGEQVGVDTGIGAVLIISACLFSTLGLDGIKQLFSSTGKSSQEGNDSDTKFSNIARGGFFTAAGTSFLGTLKDTAVQIHDFLVDVLQQGPPDF